MGSGQYLLSEEAYRNLTELAASPRKLSLAARQLAAYPDTYELHLPDYVVNFMKHRPARLGGPLLQYRDLVPPEVDRRRRNLALHPVDIANLASITYRLNLPVRHNTPEGRAGLALELILTFILQRNQTKLRQAQQEYLNRWKTNRDKYYGTTSSD